MVQFVKSQKPLKTKKEKEEDISIPSFIPTPTKEIIPKTSPDMSQLSERLVAADVVPGTIGAGQGILTEQLRQKYSEQAGAEEAGKLKAHRTPLAEAEISKQQGLVEQQVAQQVAKEEALKLNYNDIIGNVKNFVSGKGYFETPKGEAVRGMTLSAVAATAMLAITSGVSGAGKIVRLAGLGAATGTIGTASSRAQSSISGLAGELKKKADLDVDRVAIGENPAEIVNNLNSVILELNRLKRSAYAWNSYSLKNLLGTGGEESGKEMETKILNYIQEVENKRDTLIRSAYGI